MQDARTFYGQQPIEDDITLVVLKVNKDAELTNPSNVT